ncbi:MAG: TonB-dependent receptor [Bacteroidales bacterium]|nr:TonB-dependent receptor [Bacteroidales bacterium]
MQKKLFYGITFSVFLFFGFTKLHSQNVNEIRFNKLYVGSLAQIFDSLSSASGKKIIYDRGIFSSDRAMIRPSNETLMQVLDGLSKTFRFTYLVDNVSGNIYVYARQNEFVDVEDESETQSNISVINPRTQQSISPAKYNYTFSGQIKDRTTGEAVPFAIISIEGTNIKTNSNVDGYYSIIRVPNDTCTLIISSVGYKLTRLYLSPDLPSNNYLIELDPEVLNLKAVIVTADKRNLVLSSTSDETNLIKVSPKKLAELPQVGEKDILRSLQLMPGISASNESSAGMYVRGGTPDQNLVLFDGFTIYHVDHLYGFFSTFNPNAVKDLSLYKGGFDARYGGRLSSVCDITGKDGNQKNIAGGGDISLLSMNVFLEIPYKEKFSSIIAFRRSYQGAMYEKLFSKFNTSSTAQVGRAPVSNRFAESFTSTVSSYFYDINGKFTYRVSEQSNLTLSLYNGSDNLDNSNNPGMMGPGTGSFRGFNAQNNDLTKFGNTGASLKFSKQWTDKLYIYNLLSFSNYISNRDRTSQTTIETDTSTNTFRTGTLENNNLTDFSYKNDISYKFSDRHSLEGGTQLTQLQVKYSYSDNDTSKFLDRDNKSLLAAYYLSDHLKLLNSRLLLTTGLRSTYYQLAGKVYFEPRFNLNYKITDNITLGGSWGHFFQFVNRVIREDISSGSRDFWILSDTSHVPVSTAIHYIIGTQYETPDFLLSVEAYYKDMKDITEYTQRIVPARRQVSYEENFYIGKGYARGIEFLIQRKTGIINGWISYTLGEARNQFDVYGKNYFPAAQDVRHEFKMVGIYKYKNWVFSFDWIYASGKPYTRPLGTYTLTMIDGNEQSYVAVSAKNSGRLPAYHRLDLSATYDFPLFNRGAKGSLGFSIFNLYNRKNVWYKEFQVIEGIAVENNVSYLGITPNLSFSIKF